MQPLVTPKWRTLTCRADRVVQALSALRSRRQMSVHVMSVGSLGSADLLS